MNWDPDIYDPACRRCPRLSLHLGEIRNRFPDYFARPVPPFGAAQPRLLVVGLAPGLHGANASGRPFSGDFAGVLLYRTLHEFGLGSRPLSAGPGDGLRLRGVRITNAVKCLPPANRPTGAEMRECNAFLQAELNSLKRPLVVLALGHVAHAAVLRAWALRASRFRFAHARVHAVDPGTWLVDSYHCSRYNTQTGRLTEAMFRDVFHIVMKLIDRMI
ncbi:MAG: uracil-DNA glycosylase [Gammaproteobacteria bacterium]